MEFSYIRLPEDLVAVGAGGRVEFMRLPNGVWIVRDWLIRMPYAKWKQQAMAMGMRPEVTGFREKGGAPISSGRGTVRSCTALLPFRSWRLHGPYRFPNPRPPRQHRPPLCQLRQRQVPHPRADETATPT